MAERREQQPEKKEEDLPDYFASLGAGSPKPRQKYGGMFCNVEGAFENKTLNFASFRCEKRKESRKLHGEDSSQQPSESEEKIETSNGTTSVPEPRPPSPGVREQPPTGGHQVKEKTRGGGAIVIAGRSDLLGFPINFIRHSPSPLGLAPLFRECI